MLVLNANSTWSVTNFVSLLYNMRLVLKHVIEREPLKVIYLVAATGKTKK